MNVFAIGDLHLPGGAQKPMDVFGLHWANHFNRIQTDWVERVTDDDLILLPGDISWAMRLSEAKDDLEAIGALPGRKVLLRGNHDFWWSSISQMRALLPKRMYALQNNAYLFDNVLIYGARGWLCPGSAAYTNEDAHIYARELLRLEMSLEDGIKHDPSSRWRIAMLHYPPFVDPAQDTEVSAILERYQIHDVVYGHLHGPGLAAAFSGKRNGIRYHQVSCDGLGFQLHKLLPLDQ